MNQGQAERRECNKANMRLWVAGLRAGIFPQGNARLKYRDDDGKIQYCCLGVACDLAVIHGVNIKQRLRDNNVFELSGKVGLLPTNVVAWLGLPYGDDDVYLLHEDTFIRASSANDTLGMSFDQIADLIVSTYGLEDGDDTAEQDQQAGPVVAQ